MLKKLKFPSYLVITIILTFGLSISLQSLLAAWVPPTSNPPDAPAISQPLYNDGTLTNPIINNELTINDDFHVGIDSLFVDETNKRAGVGTANLVKNLEVQSALTGFTGNFTDRPTLRINQSNNFNYNIGDIHSALEFYTKDTWSGLQAYVAAATTRGNGISNADTGLYFGTSNSNIRASYMYPQMVISHFGNVGIGMGIASLPARLSVRGTTTIDIVNLFNAAGAEQLTVLSNGRVGVGATAPIAKVDIDMRALTTTEGLHISRDAAGYAYLNIVNESANSIFKVHESGNVGIGTANPGSKLDVNGRILANELGIRAFIAKVQPMDPFYISGVLDSSPSCVTSVSNLPASAQTKCSCDVSDIDIDCSSEDLSGAADYPGCYDIYEEGVSAASLYDKFPSPDCSDLSLTRMRYFTAWDMKGEDNSVSAPLLSYDNWKTIQPAANAELGQIIFDELQESNLIRIYLKAGVTYFWNKAVIIPENAKVSITVLDENEDGNWGNEAIITMNDKNTYTKADGTCDAGCRAPVRAVVLGYLSISDVKIQEILADDRNLSTNTSQKALFTIQQSGTIFLGQLEIGATEDIFLINSSEGGTAILWNAYIFNRAISPRPDLYIARATVSGGISAKISFSSIYLNQRIGGVAAGQGGVQKYPPNLNEMKRLDYTADSVIIQQGGNVGINMMNPNDALDVVGNIDMTGCLQEDDTTTIGGTCVSDARLKENIKPIKGSLEKILNLRPVTFDWIKKYEEISKEKGSSVGLIAQELEEVFPDLVVTDENGYKKVKYNIELEMHLIQAIKEQQGEIEEQREEINSLKKIICNKYPDEKVCDYKK